MVRSRSFLIKVLFTRVFIAVLVLIFSLQSWTKADDISDFEIEGMSIGDSALDYLNINFINEQLSNPKSFYYKNNEFVKIGTGKQSENYDYTSITIKPNDKNYYIHALEGRIEFPSNIKECISKRNEIAKEVSNLFTDLEFLTREGKHGYDKTGKSLYYTKELTLPGGAEIRIFCMDWSKDLNERWEDTLRINLISEEFMEFLSDPF